jgi:polyisoprenoid-binding protein YceI
MQIHQKVLYLLLSSLTVSAAFAGNFKIDKDKSELAATMHASPPHGFTSVAKNYVYDIEIDPETLSVNKAVCSFKFADLDSGKNSRDKKMCKWMNVEKYPKAAFEMKSQLPDNASNEHVARGSFTMHGVERPITIAYTLKREGKQIILDGHCQFDHKDWGLEQVRLLFFAVDTLLKPHFHLVGTLEQ